MPVEAESGAEAEEVPAEAAVEAPEVAEPAASEEEVSLEAILEDLRRREGRTE